MADYNASSITILEHEQVMEKFFWAKAGDLSIRYRKPQEWIERGLLACERVRVPHDYFIDRYLKKLGIPMDQAVDAAMRDLLIEMRPGPNKASQERERMLTALYQENA